MKLDTKIEEIPRVGFFHSSRLKHLKILTLEDLINHYPFRYENVGEGKKISSLNLGETASVKGQVWGIKNIRTRFGKYLTIASIHDGNESIESVWFNQPFLTKTIPTGTSIGLAGKVDLFSNKPTFINPDYEILNANLQSGIHTQGLVPIYPETAKISSKWLRSLIKEWLPKVLAQIEDFLPEESIKRNNLISKKKAIWQIHFPKNNKQIEESRHRLAFDEFLLTSLKVLRTKEAWQQNYQSVKLNVNQDETLSLIDSLPFNLTKSQSRSSKEILQDFQSNKPMNRILQGDVGSGKTVVASIAAYNAALNGYQTAFMAPTTILAHQHHSTLKAILEPKGLKIGLQTSQVKERGEFDILVGTHALLSNKSLFHKLAFVVIDEQHRFGVRQRALLRSRSKTPHVLTMTATPIPRSLALTLYGDLAISTIDELPVGRKTVKTSIVPPQKRNQAYQFIRKQVGLGKQAFILCPLIEESETLWSVKAATVEYARLQKDVYPDLKLGLLHGRMKSAEKEAVLQQFKKNEMAILVSTPVVEVGIDIPGATVMLIEAAERFGLASLHQLRGRVGRSSDQAYCLLFTESPSEKVTNRLLALEKHFLGSELAEIDLKTRGPGEIYGTAQSGLPTFKIASLLDTKLIKKTKDEAEKLYKNISSNRLSKLQSLIESYNDISPD